MITGLLTRLIAVLWLVLAPLMFVLDIRGLRTSYRYLVAIGGSEERVMGNPEYHEFVHLAQKMMQPNEPVLLYASDKVTYGARAFSVKVSAVQRIRYSFYPHPIVLVYEPITPQPLARFLIVRRPENIPEPTIPEGWQQVLERDRYRLFIWQPE